MKTPAILLALAVMAETLAPGALLGTGTAQADPIRTPSLSNGATSTSKYTSRCRWYEVRCLRRS